MKIGAYRPVRVSAIPPPGLVLALCRFDSGSTACTRLWRQLSLSQSKEVWRNSVTGSETTLSGPMQDPGTVTRRPRSTAHSGQAGEHAQSALHKPPAGSTETWSPRRPPASCSPTTWRPSRASCASCSSSCRPARACPADHGTGSRSQMMIKATSMVPWQIRSRLS